MNKFLLAIGACALSASSALAGAAAPAIRSFVPSDQDGQVFHMSDNGKWGVGQSFDDNAQYSRPFLMGFEDNSFTRLYTDSNKETVGRANDVTDDGMIVAGSWNNNPAIYHVDTGKWEKMPVPPGFTYQEGQISAITPDGKYAVGYFWMGVQNVNGVTSYIERSMMWDLSGSKIKFLDLQNVPSFDTMGYSADSVRFIDITADGSKILGFVNFTAPMTAWTFLYDVAAQSYTPVGADIIGQYVVPSSDEILAVDEGKFSKDGKYIGVTVYDSHDDQAIAIYNIASGDFYLVPESNGMLFGDIDNNGVIYASSPNTSPVRNWSFFAQGYWFDFKQVLKQEWGIDWQKDFLKDDMGLSGTVAAVTGDGLDIMAAHYTQRPTRLFKIGLDTPLHELAKTLDPLANYTVTPAAGSVFSTVRNITINFDRDVTVVGDKSSVLLLDEDGNEAYHSIGLATQASQDNVVVATFRNATLDEGKTYTLVVPAGAIQIKGDANRANREIRVNYSGRANVPVKPVVIAPEPGTGMPILSMGTNPINILFDAVLSPLDGTIDLYNYQDDQWQFLTTMAGDIQGSMLNVYPLGEVRLAKDVRYKVVINKNTVGDLAGNNGNEEFSFEYVGTFERDPESDNGVVYQIDFNYGFEDMMLYDGDQRMPQNAVSDWGFTYEYPWWTVRESNDSMDSAAASHSMYNPAGKSDDWMITPQLFIPDDKCSLSFQSQSYKFGCEDHLKIYVYATESKYTAPITTAVVDKFKENAVLIYDKVQDPGASEEGMDGEWTDNEISLAQFAGKDIYIAFVNDNEDQSAVFIDNIAVLRDMDFALGISTEKYVVDQTDIAVSGRLEVLVPNEYDGIELVLQNEEGDEIDRITKTGTFTKGDAFNFSFDNPLPLQKSVSNPYFVYAKVGNVSTIYKGSVVNLNFKPRRTVVVEEATGTKCGFCPLGHRALEVLEDMYGDQVIPVAIHCYSGGSDFGTDWTMSYGSFHGFNSAPVASLNREVIAGPFAVDDNTGMYIYNDPVNQSTWFDIISKQITELTDAEIEVNDAVINPEAKTISVSAAMRYAYNNDNTNLNLHTVVLENGLRGRQSSNVYNNTSETLGPWGKGGAYGSATATYMYDHIARGMHGRNFNGVSGFFPRQLTAGEVYDANYTFDIPTYLTDVNSAEVVVMLIDVNSGRILNAARKPLKVDGSGVDTVSAAVFSGKVYSVTGSVVLDNASEADINNLEPGIYICNGRKIIIR